MVIFWNRRYRIKLSLLIYCWLSAYATVFAQKGIEGLNLFNRAQYDSVIQYFNPDYLKLNPQEEGIARYLLAESYYNKAVIEKDDSNKTLFLQQAWTHFKLAWESSDLKNEYQEYYYFCRYKSGWCSFRLAELSETPTEKLQRASREFMDIQPDAPDSIKIHSQYMAAECLVRVNLLKIYRIADDDHLATEINEIVKSYETIKNVYNKIVNYSPTPSAPANLQTLQAAAWIKRESLKYYSGKLYQVLSPDEFSLVLDANKKSNSSQTALFYFTSLHYDSLFVLFPSLGNQFRSIVSYLSLIKELNRYFLTRTDAAKIAFLTAWSDLDDSQFAMERLFRIANLHQNHPDVEGTDFNEQTIHFYDSSTNIDESQYWLGNIRLIQNEDAKSRAHFVNFIEKINEQKYISHRQKVLLEEAQLKIILLDFESFYLSNNYQKLRKLAGVIRNFSPESQIIHKRREWLNLLINCSLTRNTTQLWSQVLRGSDNEKLEQALNTILFILPRAALNIGPTREKYILLLDRLFEITNIRRSNETHFFRGIVKTLEAEIQASPFDKIQKFKEAAEILSSIDSNYIYKNEADYIRGRCLFFADEFESAAKIFKRLINEYGYLRALFYLAEIYRLDNQGAAAKKCYKIIIDRLENTEAHFGEYWLVNAKAGLSSSDDSGGLDVLAEINVDSVNFKPNLESRQLNYEILADENYLKRQYARESVDWLQKFGLPQKEIYPSIHHIKNSVFVNENIFENIPGMINEIRGAVTVTFNLVVWLPENVKPEIKVKFGDEVLEGKDRQYMRRRIQLNSVFKMYVQNVDCYDYLETLHFSRAGEYKKEVLLNKKIVFSNQKTVSSKLSKFESLFTRRWDGNYILNRDISNLNLDSQIMKDFAHLYELRDFAQDKVGERILAVNAAENAVWIYSSEASGQKIGTMNLQIPLNSPEGIAVDSRGDIYVTDWGNHRVMHFDNNGKVVQEIGRLGLNQTKDIGQPVKFVFPTRLAVVEDNEGVEINGKKFYREKYLFVADQNGIHICNMNGEYLGTPLSPNQLFPRGSFYGFVIENYGQETRLHVVNRKKTAKDKVVEFFVSTLH